MVAAAQDPFGAPLCSTPLSRAVCVSLSPFVPALSDSESGGDWPMCAWCVRCVWCRSGRSCRRDGDGKRVLRDPPPPVGIVTLQEWRRAQPCCKRCQRGTDSVTSPRLFFVRVVTCPRTPACIGRVPPTPVPPPVRAAPPRGRRPAADGACPPIRDGCCLAPPRSVLRPSLWLAAPLAPSLPGRVPARDRPAT